MRSKAASTRPRSRRTCSGGVVSSGSKAGKQRILEAEVAPHLLALSCGSVVGVRQMGLRSGIRLGTGYGVWGVG